MEEHQWRDDFSVGNQEIDDQHKKWFEILNTAHNKMLGNIKSDIDDIGQSALKSVVDYTKFHFSFEEEYMTEINFYDLNRHKNLHKDFIKKIEQIGLEIHNGELVLNSEIIKVIERWLTDHILNEDQKYKIL